MTGRRRRAALLLGLALLLGGLAASDVARREAAVESRLAPIVSVVVARADLEAGQALGLDDLAVRRIPERFAPAGSAAEPAELVGRKVGVGVPAGGYLAGGQLEGSVGAQGAGSEGVRRGERAADVVGVGSPQLVRPGARIDVLVTRPGEGGEDGATRLALQDVEVLDASQAPATGSQAEDPAVPRVAATLRVTVRQAVYLAAAQSFAREMRFLSRAPGDRRRSSSGLSVGERLR